MLLMVKQLVGGRTAKVNFPEVPRGGEREVIASRARSSYQENFNSPHRLYASNLSWNLTSQGLREAFADQPGILNAKIVYDKETGRSRGFGFISFASAGELESALNAMDGVVKFTKYLPVYSVEVERKSLLFIFSV